ncbi:MAG: type IV secretory system conjugative DNA transfer family protein [Haliea sp.]|nr:type IV secretory system conjugative DNA transfer family protein [Haliea sp.]
MVRGCFFVGIGAAIGLVPLQLHEVLALAQVYLACGLAFAGIYDLYIAAKAYGFRRATVKLRHEANLTSKHLDTNKLLGNAEIKALSESVREDHIFLGSLENGAVFAKPTHMITYGGPGSGKGTSAVIPNLLMWQGSVFVTDPKGENAAVTAKYRRDSLGQRIVYLNPWHELGLPNTNFNPLEIIVESVRRTRDPNSAQKEKNNELSDARAIASILVPEPLDPGQNQWVRERARTLIAAFILYLAYIKPEKCTLPTIHKCLMQAEKEYLAHFEYMVYLPPNLAKGALQKFGSSLLDDYFKQAREHQTGRNEATEKLAIFDEADKLADSITSTQVSLREFVSSGNVTIYAILPLKYVQSHGRWAGLVAANIFEAIGSCGKGRPVLTLLDEYCNLGRLHTLDKLAAYRGHGLRAWLIVQSQAQLQALCGEKEATALEDMCNVKQYMQVSGNTAQQLSNRIGNKTVKLKTATGMHGQFDPTYHTGSEAVAVHAVPAMSTAELEHLGDDQIVFVDGRPMRIQKCPYWNIDPCRKYAAPNPFEQGRMPAAAKRMVRI